jgi:hypothetical protein
MIEAIGDRFSRCGFRFVPLVNEHMGHVTCSLDILFLRRDHPGGLVSNTGDIDNRIKVLFDALRMPGDCQEVDGEVPEAGENPIALSPTGRQAHNRCTDCYRPAPYSIKWKCERSGIGHRSQDCGHSKSRCSDGVSMKRRISIPTSMLYVRPGSPQHLNKSQHNDLQSGKIRYNKEARKPPAASPQAYS